MQGLWFRCSQVEPAGICKGMEPSPRRIYRRNTRMRKKSQSWTCILCFGLYTLVANTPIHYPLLLTKQTLILFWASVPQYYKPLSFPDSTAARGGTWPTSGQWDVSRARWVGLWATCLLPSTSLLAESAVASAAFFFFFLPWEGPAECWAGQQKYRSSPDPWWLVANTALTMACHSCSFYYLSHTLFKLLFVGSSLCAATHNTWLIEIWIQVNSAVTTYDVLDLGIQRWERYNPLPSISSQTSAWEKIHKQTIIG